MAKKKYKVIVVGLPKTGTSTLAVMLRMLGYQVTGPDIQFVKGDLDYLHNRFDAYDAFQDYPWCFEWQKFLKYDNVKFIILKRDLESWWKSFFYSYGGEGQKYLSYPYIKIDKTMENKTKFTDYFSAHYNDVNDLKHTKSHEYLEIDVKSLKWKDLCDFLGEPIPKDFLGRFVKVPHAKFNHAVTRRTNKYILYMNIREFLLPIIGEKSWNKFIVFLRKNKIYK